MNVHRDVVNSVRLLIKVPHSVDHHVVFYGLFEGHGTPPGYFWNRPLLNCSFLFDTAHDCYLFARGRQVEVGRPDSFVFFFDFFDEQICILFVDGATFLNNFNKLSDELVFRILGLVLQSVLAFAIAIAPSLFNCDLLVLPNVVCVSLLVEQDVRLSLKRECLQRGFIAAVTHVVITRAEQVL